MNLPLQGKKILVTREKKQAKSMVKKITNQGGISIEVPLLEFEYNETDETKKLFKQLDTYDWILLTSANGVRFFMDGIQKHSKQAELSRLKYAVVGKKTNKALQMFNLHADFIPSTYTGATMAQQFLQCYYQEKLLFIRGNLSKQTIPNQLEKAGADYNVATLYCTKHNSRMKEKLEEVLNSESLDALTFTSPSTLDAFRAFASKENLNKALRLPCVCIGTTTEQKAKQVGFEHTIVPTEYTIDGMINELCSLFST